MMMDYNILNRGSFNDTEITHDITVTPSQTSKSWHELGDYTSLLLKEISWKYSVPGGQTDAYCWPRQGLHVAITDAFKARVASPVLLNPAPLLKNKYEVIISNPSTVAVTVHMLLKGVLVKQNPGEPLLSDKEIRGYSLLDDSQKGMMALSEAVIDRIDDHFKQLGLAGLRDRLPGGQVANINMLSAELKQMAALPNSSPNELELHVEPRAIEPPKVDSEMLKALLIGELVTCKTEKSFDLTLEDITFLASYLINKGWMK